MILSNGNKAANGFEALKDLDSNNDGKIDNQDTNFNNLKIWQDKNSDGKLDDWNRRKIKFKTAKSSNILSCLAKISQIHIKPNIIHFVSCACCGGKITYGNKAANGFEALKDLDSNNDGKIDNQDTNFNTMLWTIKYRLRSITVYFTFTVPEL
jgi:hypothetical protein